MVWMCADGASSCPPYKCLRTFLHKSLLYLPQICEETNALLVFVTQTFNRGGDGKCTKCNKAEGEHYNHSNGNKYCYVSTTSPCLPPHTYGFVLLSYAKLLVCRADSLFGLDVRREWCVVLSSLQVPPHLFTQKSALFTSGIRKRQTACVLC